MSAIHNPEDEQIALDAKCPNTLDMFSNPRSVATADALMKIFGFKRVPHVMADKCIADDFPKPIYQREAATP